MLARMWRNWDPQTLLVGMQNGVALFETAWHVRTWLKIELPSDPPIPLLGMKTYVLTNTCTPMSRAAFVTVA